MADWMIWKLWFILMDTDEATMMLPLPLLTRAVLTVMIQSI